MVELKDQASSKRWRAQNFTLVPDVDGTGSGSLLNQICLQLEGSFIYRGLTVYTLQNLEGGKPLLIVSGLMLLAVPYYYPQVTPGLFPSTSKRIQCILG